MIGLLGFTINPWSKPTWFKLFRSTAHSLFYNCSSNMAMRTVLAFASLAELGLLIFCFKGNTLLVPAVNPGNDLNLIILE